MGTHSDSEESMPDLVSADGHPLCSFCAYRGRDYCEEGCLGSQHGHGRWAKVLDEHGRITKSFRGQDEEHRFQRARRYRHDYEIGAESTSSTEEENSVSPRVPTTYCIHENCECETTWAHGMVPAGVCEDCFGRNSEECIDKGGYCL